MLLNAAMCFERSNHLNADLYERVQARTGHANGFKPRSLQTVIGELNLALP
jgi:putative transposase